MEFIGASICIFLILFSCNHLIKKKKFFLDNKKSSPHKAFIEKTTTPPFSGGVLILLSLFILIPNSDINFKILILLMFTTGFLSDIGILKSANFRFIIQIILVFFTVIFLEKYVLASRWNLLDMLLLNYYFKLFFTSFCILILINGTNFMDGLNTIVVGYYLLIIYFISSFYQVDSLLIFSSKIINYVMIVLLCIFILNGLNLLYLGDSGAYLLSFFIGIVLIDLSNNIKTLSPYYIVNLLWYPAYENLFSIIRKIKSKKSALKPDNLHLHQLIFLFIKSHFKFELKFLNTFSGIIINLFNLLIFLIATENYSNTKIQVMILIVSLIFYNSVYFTLNKKFKRII